MSARPLLGSFMIERPTALPPIHDSVQSAVSLWMRPSHTGGSLAFVASGGVLIVFRSFVMFSGYSKRNGNVMLNRYCAGVS